MDDGKLLKTGIAGSVVAAVCCATPVLVILLGTVGLSAWVGWLDFVLIPALVVFGGLTIYSLLRRRAKGACCPLPGQPKAKNGEMG